MAASSAAEERRSLLKTSLDSTLSTFLANLLRYSILFGAFIACLGAVGFHTTSLAAISVPNSSVFNQVLENISYYPTRRVELAVTTPIEFDLETDLTAGVNWQLRAWCKTEEYALVHQAMVRAAKQVLDEIRNGKLAQ